RRSPPSTSAAATNTRGSIAATPHNPEQGAYRRWFSATSEPPVQLHCSPVELVLISTVMSHGTMRYHQNQGEQEAALFDDRTKAPSAREGRKRGTRSDPRGGLCCFHEERLRGRQYPRDRDPRPRFQARALRSGRQQTGNADRLHHAPRQEAG